MALLCSHSLTYVQDKFIALKRILRNYLECFLLQDCTIATEVLLFILNHSKGDVSSVNFIILNHSREYRKLLLSALVRELVAKHDINDGHVTAWNSHNQMNMDHRLLTINMATQTRGRSNGIQRNDTLKDGGFQ